MNVATTEVPEFGSRLVSLVALCHRQDPLVHPGRVTLPRSSFTRTDLWVSPLSPVYREVTALIQVC